MIKKLIFSATIIFCGVTNAQNLLMENFDDVNNLRTRGWEMINLSSPIGATANWIQGMPNVFAAQQGANNAYIIASYNNVAGNNTISNWLITPQLTLNNNDEISFWARSYENVYADRLQVYLNTTGGANPTGSNEDLGGFTNLLLEINPTQTANGFPISWTKYTITVSGLNGPTNCKIAFRYYVQNGGPAGSASERLGIDTFNVDRTALQTTSFGFSKTKMYPNPASDILKFENLQGFDSITVSDINGKIIKEFNPISNNLDVEIKDLAKGVYLVSLKNNKTTETQRLIVN